MSRFKEKTLLIVFLMAFAVLAGARLWSYNNTIAGVQTATRNAQIARNENEITTCLSLLTDAETGQRGFILTGRDEYLEPYDKALKLLPGHLDSLTVELAGNQPQMAALAETRRLAALKIAELGSVISTFRAQGRDKARVIIESGTGKTYMDQFRASIINLQGLESRRLAETNAAALEAQHRGYVASVVFTAVEITLLLAAFAAIAGYSRTRRHAEIRLNEQLALSQAANRAKSLFLANTSHELRTPLNAIIGYSEMLMENESLGAANSEAAADLKKIHAAGRQLLSLINDILDLSKIEAGKMTSTVQRFDVSELVREVVATVQPVAVRNGNSLEVECDSGAGLMDSDRGKVQQILLNLLTNALKFTERGTVGLRVTRDKSGGAEMLNFAVRDTGIGMSREQIERLFQVFSQADPTISTKYGGTGLGLAISQRLCRILGGDITVTSRPGAGSVFTACLPVRAPVVTAALAASAPALHPLPLKPGRVVLVIDDDPAARDLLVRIIAADGYEVVAASGGEDGLRLARQYLPMAVTLDLLMPGMDGWAVLAAMKADAALSRIPVVIVTIFDDSGRGAGAAFGASEFLTKPVDRDLLTQTLAKYRPAETGDAAAPIFIVEDDADTREMVSRTLRKEGWHVQEAGDGQAALDAVAARPPAAIVLDLMMPRMDGFQFLTEFRKNRANLTIPVIVLTAMVISDADLGRLRGGVISIIAKGENSREELISQLGRILNGVAESGVQSEAA